MSARHKRDRSHGRRDRRRPVRRVAQGESLVGVRFEVEVGEVAHGGHCVARHDGRVVFVRHALPGERVVAQVTDGGSASRFLRADAVEVRRASAERREAPCRFAGPGGCGGCDWQHTSAAFGRELKTRVVREQLRRLAGIEWSGEVEPVPGDEDGLRWRTRVEFAVGADRRLGLRKHRSHDVVPVDDCLIGVPEIAATGLLTERVEEGVTGVDVTVASDGEVIAVDLPLTAGRVADRKPGSAGRVADRKPGSAGRVADRKPGSAGRVADRRSAAGEVRVSRPDIPNVVERVVVPGRGARDFSVSARGFWQVHPGAAATFVGAALDGLQPQPGDRVLDLYAGVGVFTAFLADAVGPTGRVLGLEGDARAVADGQGNLAELPHASLDRADIGRAGWADPVSRFDRVDLVVLDPPRSGAGREIIREVLSRQPRRAAYIACDPAALARDLSCAADAGYRVVSLRAFDAFPMTHHVECVAIVEPAP